MEDPIYRREGHTMLRLTIGRNIADNIIHPCLKLRESTLSRSLVKYLWLRLPHTSFITQISRDDELC